LVLPEASKLQKNGSSPNGQATYLAPDARFTCAVELVAAAATALA